MRRLGTHHTCPHDLIFFKPQRLTLSLSFFLFSRSLPPPPLSLFFFLLLLFSLFGALSLLFSPLSLFFISRSLLLLSLLSLYPLELSLSLSLFSLSFLHAFSPFPFPHDLIFFLTVATCLPRLEMVLLHCMIGSHETILPPPAGKGHGFSCIRIAQMVEGRLPGRGKGTTSSNLSVSLSLFFSASSSSPSLSFFYFSASLFLFSSPSSSSSPPSFFYFSASLFLVSLFGGGRAAACCGHPQLGSPPGSEGVCCRIALFFSRRGEEATQALAAV